MQAISAFDGQLAINISAEHVLAIMQSSLINNKQGLVGRSFAKHDCASVCLARKLGSGHRHSSASPVGWVVDPCSTRSPSGSSRTHRAAETDEAAPAPAVDLSSPSSLEKEAYEVVDYAIKFAYTSETYEVHSWMLVLGILKHEQSVAALILKDLGLDDLYGAWNETLWALNACNGLEPRAFIPTVQFGARAYAVLEAAIQFASLQNREKVRSEDILLALAAGDVLKGLFPDVNLSVDAVKAAIEKWSGIDYKLPGSSDEDAPKGDLFL